LIKSVQPDFTWIKRREVNSHRLFDAVRGATKFIESDSTAAEVTDAQELKSFDSDGFTLGTATKVNASAGTYASWNWRASNTTAVSNTDGDITSTVSASTTSGFSIVKYTGTGANATVGHGLGVAPKIVLVKDLSASASWRMFTEMTGNQSQLALDQTSAADSGNTTMWNSTSPTNTTFSIGTHPNVNTSSNNYIAYCFSPVRGFSSMGSYIGNGSADGSFIYTNGMKPSWLMIKRTDLADSWFMYDNKRSSFNVVDDYLIANGSGAEVSTSAVNLDFLSNGFKIRNTDGGHNNSGGTYIYIAFAESPIVSSNGVPATAR
jgi:hypothetical protein